jgi:F-type H+-transporting ATPase subunit a
VLSNLLTRLAAESSGPTIHITPSELFTIGGYSISNSMFYAWISGLVIALLLIVSARMATVRPRKGFIQFFEIGTDFITGLIENSMHDRAKALKYSPYFVTIFFFIMLNNWLGLLPGVGEALTYNDTPIFRPFTADLNGTLAIAVVSMTIIQYFAIKESGFLKHLRHYFTGSLLNPMTLFFGVFEIFTEFTRVGSLALRLFLNVVIGEIIISVFTYLGAFAAPITALPFVFLEMAVGGLQAYIFVMLSVTYLSVAIHHGAEHEEEDAEHQPITAAGKTS